MSRDLHRIGVGILIVTAIMIVPLALTAIISAPEPSVVSEVQESVDNLQEVTGELQDTIETLQEMGTEAPAVADQLESIDEQLSEVGQQLENLEQTVPEAQEALSEHTAEQAEDITENIFTVVSWIIGLLSICIAIVLAFTLSRKRNRKKRLQLNTPVDLFKVKIIK